MLYPLTFNPILKNKIWGSELWLLSALHGNETQVSEGRLKDNTINELLEVFMDDLVGEKVFTENMTEFPLLLKLISSIDWLSVQVHPDDIYAKSIGLKNGKSEIWYIIDAEPNSQIIAGFKEKINTEDYIFHLNNNSLETILNYVNVKKGDTILIPAGMVHALGPGILLAEIQQSSDTTYRIYDWNRKGENNQTRELHLESALNAINFELYVENICTQQEGNCSKELFNTSWSKTGFTRISSLTNVNYHSKESFVILVFVEGKGEFTDNNTKLGYTKGSTVLIPAYCNKCTINPETQTSFITIEK